MCHEFEGELDQHERWIAWMSGRARQYGGVHGEAAMAKAGAQGEQLRWGEIDGRLKSDMEPMALWHEDEAERHVARWRTSSGMDVAEGNDRRSTVAKHRERWRL